jgi:hypothetical protein
VRFLLPGGNSTGAIASSAGVASLAGIDVEPGAGHAQGLSWAEMIGTPGDWGGVSKSRTSPRTNRLQTGRRRIRIVDFLDCCIQ